MQTLLEIDHRAGFLFNVQPCSEEQALEILRDRSVLPCLKFYPAGLKDVERWLIGSALLIVMPQGDRAEVHIACKFRDRAKMFEVLQGGVRWLKIRGFKEVFTTAPDGRIALVNMLKNLGFEKNSEGWSQWV